ncbi:serine hydrolase domain-containing protein [Cesiribacter andamanensis]|uniref:D-alanyl-D-alanine carboxypeptidase n=1 Tax=Cesiribacter andamanensis AMV16 TaxID=1279009 RepID=M7NSZ5_9BACT|nr:serine hydrolase domain-containing protein [Cesiribacter andamanensis]EMR04785.1 D-alanyl-D-alanine carboxypeptidase precursor [Cesiribacter andamanensis AMV16]
MNYRLIALLLTSTPLPGVVAQVPDPVQQPMHALLQEQELTGAVWTVREADSSIKTGSAGVKNAATGEALRPTDKVHIGSITKTVLATGILRLASEGKLSLEDPLSMYLPHIPIINPWEARHPLRIRHLLDHTSGLSDLRLWHFFSTTPSPTEPLKAFYENDPALLRVQAQPGTVFSYSNMGYTLLGMVVEAVVQQPYEAYLDEHLLKPLGMHQSTFRFVSQEGEGADPALAMGHLDGAVPHPAVAIYLRPAGQFTTTAHDMGLFMRFLLGNGQLEGVPFIEESLLKQMGSATATLAAQKGVAYGYSLGAYRRDRHGVVGVAHSGNVLGYRAFMCLFPDEGKAFFIAHNMDSETADYEQFNSLMIRQLKISQKAFVAKAQPVAGLEPWQGFYLPQLTKVEPFRLLDYALSHARLVLTDSGASLAPFQKQARELRYAGAHLFVAEGRTAPSHAFYTSEAGEYFITDGISTLQKVSGIKILLVTASLMLGTLGLMYILFSALYQAFRFGGRFRTQPIVWVSGALLMVLAALGALLAQPFMALGDKTIGSLLLALGSGLLLLLSSVSLFQYILHPRSTFYQKADVVALCCLLQCLLLLLVNGLLPLRLWA